MANSIVNSISTNINPNILINGDMRVNQRGLFPVTSPTNGTYYMDRWFHIEVAGGSSTLSEETSLQPSQLSGSKSLKSDCTIASTSDSKFGAGQVIEDFALYAGKTVTLSMYVKSNITDARLSIYDGASHVITSSGHSGSGNWEKMTATVTLGSSITSLQAFIRKTTSTNGILPVAFGDFIEFTGAKLELGSLATEFENPDHTLETIKSTPVNYANVNPNILINGDMRVNQRGLLPITTAPGVIGSKYYVDRWKTHIFGIEANASLETTLQPSELSGSESLKYICTDYDSLDPEDGFLGAFQQVENGTDFRGKTVTLSMYVKSNTSDARIGIHDGTGWSILPNHSGSGNWEKLTVTVNISNSSSNISAYVRIMDSVGSITPMEVNDYIEFTGAKLELGSIATDFVADSYADSLRKCQRYYQKSYNKGNFAGDTTSNGSISSGLLTGFLLHSGSIRFIVPMRAIPTLY